MDVSGYNPGCVNKYNLGKLAAAAGCRWKVRNVKAISGHKRTRVFAYQAASLVTSKLFLKEGID